MTKDLTESKGTKDMYSDAYGFYVNTDYALLKTSGRYKTYTFKILRANPSQDILENLVIDTITNETLKFLITYPRLNDTFDFENTIVEEIFDDSITASKNASANCYMVLQYQAAFIELPCVVTDEPGSGDGTHMPGDNCGASQDNQPSTVEVAGSWTEVEYCNSQTTTCRGCSGGASPDPVQIGGGSSGGSGDDGIGTTPYEPIDIYEQRLLTFIENSLSQQQQDWINNIDNDRVKFRKSIKLFFEEHQFSIESQYFVLDIILFEMDTDWRQALKNAIANGITSTAELTHRVYTKLSELATAYPQYIDNINNIVDELRDIVDEVTDTNSLTCGWGDLFNMWLFELGPETINFSNLSFTTESLKQQEGVNDARNVALTAIGNGILSIEPQQWQYGQDQFYDGIADGNLQTAFLGSYDTNVTITAVSGGHNLTFFITNTSGWASATRFRIDNDNNGQHDGIFPDKVRGVGINLGGDFKQNWSWTEFIAN